MNRLKDTILVILVLALAGETWFAAHAIAVANRRIVELRQERGNSRERLRQFRIEQAAPVRTAPPTAAPRRTDSLEARTQQIFQQFNALRSWFVQHPDQKTGEMALLEESSWVRNAAQMSGSPSDADFREAAGSLRGEGKTMFMQGPLDKALTAYIQNSGNQLPSDVGQLAPFLDPKIDPNLLQHYVMIASGPATHETFAIAWNPQTGMVDPKYDQEVLAIGPGGMGSRGGPNPAATLDQMQAENAYQLAHDNAMPSTPEAVAPYFRNPQFAAEYLAHLANRH